MTRKQIALWLSASAALCAVPAGFVLAQSDDAQEKSSLIRYVEEQLSTPNRQIRLNGIEGTLSSNVRFDSITISDENGVWLTIERPSLQWRRTALLTGKLDIESLTAERIDWPRNPVPDETLPAPEASGFALPELPVSVAIDQIAITEAQFGAPVFGLASSLSLNGAVSLEDGALNANLDIERLDGPGGQLTLATAYSNDTTQLDLDFSLQEPANGVVANLANIPDRPPVALAITGSGQLDDFNAELAFDVEGERTATGTLRIADDRSGDRAIALDISGPIARILPTEHRAFFGDETALTAETILRADGGMDIRSLAVDSGALDISAAGSTLADGFLRDLTVDLTLRSIDARPVRLPVSGDAITIDNGALALRYGVNGADSWSLSGSLNGMTLPDARIDAVEIEGGGQIRDMNTAASRSIDYTINGTARGIAPDDAGIAAAVGDEITFTAEGGWNAGEPVRIARTALSGDTLRVAAQGLIEELSFKGQARVDATNLQAFSLVADRDLAGRAALAIDGDIALAGGGFDLVLDGTLTDARVGSPVADKLLNGQTRLTGGAARTPDGLRFTDLVLANPQAQTRVNGTYATRSADLRVTAEIAEIARIVDNGSGRLSLEASIDKPEGSERETPFDVAARLALSSGRLAGRAVPNATFAFDGRIAGDDLSGMISGNGLVDGETLELSGALARAGERFSLSGLAARIGSAQLAGDLSVDNTRLGGRLDIAADEIAPLAALALVEASGAVNGTVDVSGTTSDPQLAFSLRGANLTAPQLREASISPVTLSADGRFGGNAVRLSQLSVQNAQDLNFTGSGTIPLSGSGLSVKVNGAVPLGLAERYLLERGTRVSGTLRVDASVSGSLSAPQADGLFSISNASVVDPQSNLRLNGIGLVAGLRGDTLSISQMSGQLADGGSIAVSGTVGLAAPLPANISIRLSNAVYSDGATVRTKLSGDLSVTGGLMAGPLLSGQINLLGTEITVPETLTGEVDLLDVKHVAADSDTLRTLSRMQAVLPKESGGAPQAPIRLDLTINSPNQIFLRGRGIDAELGGRLRVVGPLDDLEPIGAFNLIRGRLSILNKRLEFTEGRITLTGSLDPTIDLTAQVEANDIVASMRLSGRASDLSLTLSSSPELPQDEILASILFGKSISNLSPLQIASLATAAASLASGGGGGGLSEQIRGGIGVDDLDLTRDTEGNVAVRAGKYIQDNVYLDVQAGQSGGEASINLDITDALTAKGTVTSEGDSRLGIFFEKDY